MNYGKIIEIVGKTMKKNTLIYSKKQLDQLNDSIGQLENLEDLSEEMDNLMIMKIEKALGIDLEGEIVRDRSMEIGIEVEITNETKASVVGENK